MHASIPGLACPVETSERAMYPTTIDSLVRDLVNGAFHVTPSRWRAPASPEQT